MKTLFPVVTLLFFSLGALQAQVNASSVAGTVLDPSGAAIASAKVSLLNEETGVKLGAVTSAAGSYLFTPLQRGVYRLSVEVAGFKTFERGGLNVAVGEKVGLDVRLEVGDVSQKMDVTAETPLLTTTNASLENEVIRQPEDSGVAVAGAGSGATGATCARGQGA
ncbi:MAG: carboxypeptidase-like regulatory domain-containing protein [Bryobacteraceae bacterium]